MHSVEPSSPSTHDQVQFLSRISLRHLHEMLDAVPEVSNLPQQRKSTHELNLSNSSCWDHQACVANAKSNSVTEMCSAFPSCLVCFPSGLLALTQTSHQARKGHVWLHGTDLFRSLVRLWWHLYLDLLMRVLILTMDISFNSLLSFVILLCLAQNSFPIHFANDKKTDS